MKVLVTGSSGMLGQEIARQLKQKNFVVEEFSRQKGFDVRDLQQLEGKTRGMDIVIHCAALLEGAENELSETNIQGTKNVFEACKKNRVRRVVHISSFEVLNPESKLTIYGKTKKEAEKIALSYAAGIEVTVVRPVFILGKSRYWKRFFDSVKLFPPIGRRETRLQVIDVRDCASAVVFLLVAKSGIYVVAPRFSVALGEFYSAVCNALKIREKPFIPVWLALFANFFLRKVPSKNIERFAHGSDYNAEELFALGWKPVYSLRESIFNSIM